MAYVRSITAIHRRNMHISRQHIRVRFVQYCRVTRVCRCSQNWMHCRKDTLAEEINDIRHCRCVSCFPTPRSYSIRAICYHMTGKRLVLQPQQHATRWRTCAIQLFSGWLINWILKQYIKNSKYTRLGKTTRTHTRLSSADHISKHSAGLGSSESIFREWKTTHRVRTDGR